MATTEELLTEIRDMIMLFYAKEKTLAEEVEATKRARVWKGEADKNIIKK